MPPEVEEGRYGDGYFGIGDLGVQNCIRYPSMLCVTNVNAQRQLFRWNFIPFYLSPWSIHYFNSLEMSIYLSLLPIHLLKPLKKNQRHTAGSNNINHHPH